MSLLASLALFLAGLALVLFFAEKLVEGTVGTSLGLGISTFLISVVFIGFDPDNLSVGAVASFEGVAGIAVGSIVGAAMVAVALSFGITALLVPMEFRRAPKRVLVVPPLAVAFMGALAWDGVLSRIDGAALVAGFAVSVVYLVWLGRSGLSIEATGEVAEALDEAEDLTKWKSVGLFVLSLAAIVAGSEMIVLGSRTIIERMGVSDTLFGMTVLAFLVSIEELARELPAAMKGRPEITFGNVVGSVLAFFLFNAGVIALVNPVPVGSPVRRFYLPVCFATVVVISAFMAGKRMSRSAGALLVLLYAIFVVGGYVGV